MAILTFQDLKFKNKGDKAVIEFLDNYTFEIEKASLGKHNLKENSIELEGLDEQNAREKFNEILNKGLSNLTNKITGKKTLYVHSYSGIPLIGTTSFGIIDRNTNMIELRPLTGCNMNCVFCSVDEGLTSKKTTEAVVEEAYLSSETRKLVEFKNCECHIIINAQGEPTLYKPMARLIKDLRSIPEIKTITLITNGTLLTEKLIDEFAASGLTMLNISLNAIEPKIARIMEGHGAYDVEKVKKMAAHAARTNIKVCLAPVVVGGYNDEEMKKIASFAKEIGATIAIQNYLPYKQGRRPKNTEQIPWPQFYAMLEKLQKEFASKMIFSASDYSILKTKPLPKPFRKGQTVRATVIAEGRYPNEFIASAQNRIITIPESKRNHNSGDKTDLKITSDKHNIFYGKCLKD